MGRVRIVDVAREAGVSLGTVSNALNHPERVRPDTRKLIEETIDRLGYLPNQSARLLAGGTNKVFGLILPCLTHGCSVQIANGAHNEALRHGYDVIVLCVNGDESCEGRYLRFFAGMQVAGVLMQPIANPRRYEELDLPMPTVYLGASEAPYHALAVTPDYEAQGAIVAEHVLARGAERVAVIGMPDIYQRAGRLVGIRATLAAQGVENVEVIEEGRSAGTGDGARLGALLAEPAGCDHRPVRRARDRCHRGRARPGALGARRHHGRRVRRQPARVVERGEAHDLLARRIRARSQGRTAAPALDRGGRDQEVGRARASGRLRARGAAARRDARGHPPVFARAGEHGGRGCAQRGRAGRGA